MLISTNSVEPLVTIEKNLNQQFELVINHQNHGVTRVLIPFRAGSWEHLATHELQELVLFIELKGSRSSATRSQYIRQVERFAYWLHHCGHGVITEWSVQAYQKFLLDPQPIGDGSILFEPVGQETCDQYFAVIRSLISFLSEKGVLSHNVARSVKRLGISNRTAIEGIRAFSLRQWQIIQDTLDGLPTDTEGQRNRKAQMRFIITFSYETALRVGELHGHTLKNIHRISNTFALDIVGKGRRARRLTLSEHAIQAIYDYRDHCRLDRDSPFEPVPLLPKRRGVVVVTKGPNKGVHIGPSMSTKGWLKQFRDFLRVDVMEHLAPGDPFKQAEIFASEWSVFTPHSLRHSRIAHFVLEGRELLWIQRFAGHEKLDTTTKYYSLAT